MDTKSYNNDESIAEKSTINTSTNDCTKVKTHDLFPQIDEKKLLRKLDFKLIPMISILYLLAFLDRGNIGNAKIEGMIDDLHLHGNQYNLCLTIFFISYCVFEIPSNMLIKRLNPRIYLTCIMIAWGIVMTLMGIVQNFKGLFITRFFLGVCEAGLFPGIAYYLTHWYKRSELNLRQSMFFSSASIAGAFSGILAYGISKMKGVAGLNGWRWIFILEGILTVVVACLAYFFLEDFPEKAKFITEDERAFILYRLQHDSNNDAVELQNGDHSSSFFEAEVSGMNMKYFWQAIKDWQIYLHILVYYGIVCPMYGISLFMPTIIKTLGYTNEKAQLMSVPVYICAAIFSVVQAFISDKTGKRSPFILANFLTMIVGFSIALGCSPKTSPGAIYAGIFIATVGIYQSFPTCITWLANNLSGDYKRAIGMAMQIGLGNFGGAFASNFYRAQDSPHFTLGHSLCLGFIGMGLISAIVLILSYSIINKKREERIISGQYKGFSGTELAEMGDKNPYYKYRI